jgi:hypothetical protein
MGKPNGTGRSKDSRHVRLYAWLTNKPAWQALSGNAVKLLIYLATWEDGSNNGDLFMSERMAAAGIGVSKRTAGKLFDELEAHGFIRAVEKGYFSVKRGPATRWRLTWLSWPAASKPPSHEYREWKPTEQNRRAQKLHATGAEIAPMETAHRSTEAITSPMKGGDPQKCVKPTGAIIAPHSVATEEGEAGVDIRGQNDPEIAVGPIAAIDGRAAEEAIRDKITSHWTALDPKARQAWAAGHGITFQELRDYVISGGHLPFPKQVALRSAAAGVGR